MNYKVNWSAADGVFAVPDCAVDDYIKLASGKAVKVLLYIMRHKSIQTENAAQIAEELDKRMTAEDVEDALSYWEQVGLICPSDKAPVTEVQVKKAAENTVTPKVSARLDIERTNKMISPKEIAERIEESKEIDFLFKETERLLGKALNHTEQRTLIWMHDYYSMGTDILLMIIDFCKSVDKPGLNFAEKIAADWSDKGITTHEQAENEILHLQNYYSLAGQVVSRIGLNRSLTSKEREFVNVWSSMGISADLIERAYEKTANATGKVSFSYMNKIIEEWNKNNLRTLAEVEEYDRIYSENKAKSQVVKNPPSKGINYDNSADTREHSYDLNVLLSHAMNNIPQIKED